MALAATAAGALAAATYLDGKYQLRRDITLLAKKKRFEKDWARRVQQRRVSPWYLLDEVCARQPDSRAIWTRERSWTFRELYEQTARYASWFIEQGVKPGDLVAIYLLNCAEYYMLAFAMHCIGAGPALINNNLEGKALLHCLGVCEAKLLIVDDDQGCQRRVMNSLDQIEAAGTRVVTLDATLKAEISSKLVNVPDDSWRDDMKPNFPAYLIFTSGTTGLPKACPYTTQRLHLAGEHIEPTAGAKPKEDCWYCPMPLYHGTGILLSSMGLWGGLGVAVVPRFSTSRFWPDIYESESTMFIYVGETARYLLNAPPHPLERKHKVRMVRGNGMRPDVWLKFQQRFNIPEVNEFFNSSEGVLAMAVWDRGGGYLRGSVGHNGLVMRLLLRNVLIPVMIDHETGDIWRDPQTGFAKRMPYDVGGEILVAVPAREAFDGYWRNPEATNKRFAVNVFQQGDLFYRSGDALRRGPDGHWYFLDRLGDTFRWKSENVSTAEVSEALGRHANISEANVYGVAVPGHEGRAGCAAIRLNNPSQVDRGDILKHARAELPPYAVPLFLRMVKDSSHIHNHKQNKVGLRKEGVDPNLVGTEEKEGGNDAFYWLSKSKDGAEAYVPFTRQDWDKLVQGQVRL